MEPELKAEYDKVLQGVAQIMGDLKASGMIKGFALVMDDGATEEGYCLMACCPFHAAEMVDMEIVMASDDPGVLAAGVARATQMAANMFDAMEESPYMMFRDPLHGREN